ncbi:hypothetical protein [Lacibacter cauensis]|uniref:hypothetical protein n=1 Tax=Lacibacter cauensis TaxID=510947 RepID=UPI0011A31496|nr:hypothetical protein [Lacibacter cauensis]
MLSRIVNICRAIGILSFLAMCYTWFFTSDLQSFLIAKQLTITFFSVAIFLWLITLLLAYRKNK